MKNQYRFRLIESTPAFFVLTIKKSGFFYCLKTQYELLAIILLCIGAGFSGFISSVYASTIYETNFDDFTIGTINEQQGWWSPQADNFLIQNATSFSDNALWVAGSYINAWQLKEYNPITDGQISFQLFFPDTVHSQTIYITDNGRSAGGSITFGPEGVVSIPENPAFTIYPTDSWVSLLIEWRSVDEKLRYTFNGLSSDWVAANGTWEFLNEIYIYGTDGNFYIDNISEWPVNPKAITAFTISNQVGTTTISERDHTIALSMPYGTDVTALVASFVTNGSSTAVGSTTQESGTTTNDFTSPVTYTVTAADSSIQDYIITITVALNPAKEITAFTVPNQVGTTTIGESDHTIILIMPYGTDIAALVPAITITGASVSPASGEAHDFTATSTYTVTAEDSLIQDYVVTVTVTQISLTANPTAITITKSALIAAIEQSDIETAIQEAIAAGLQPMKGTLTNNSADTSANVRFIPIDAGPNIQFWAKDFTDNQWYNFNVIYGGDPAGFSIPAGYSATMDFYIISDVITDYSIIANLVLASDLSVIAYATLTVGVIAPTPTAPEVTNDDILNTITGMATSMEYSLDRADYVAYATDTFNALDFSGVHTLLVRVAATGEYPAGYITTLLFTTNVIVTPVVGTYFSAQNYTVPVSVAPTTPTVAQETDWFIKEVGHADIVRDGKIDILDFNAVMVNWDKKGIGNSADANQDGLVDIFDFNLLMVNWAKTETI
jgi:hypothetical protein